MNFDFVTDNMAIGTTPETAADIQKLVADGISHILNVRDDIDDWPLIKQTNLLYCWNGTPDWNPSEPFGGEHKPVVWFRKSLDFWKEYKDDPLFKLYVHCSAGVNRSATTVWMFLRSMQIMASDCNLIIDRHRPIAVVGTIADQPWRKDAEDALIHLGYIK